MDKFHNEKYQLISAKEAIRSEDLRKYLVENLSHFPKGTVFSLFTGQHHEKLESKVKIGKPDSRLFDPDFVGSGHFQFPPAHNQYQEQLVCHSLENHNHNQ